MESDSRERGLHIGSLKRRLATLLIGLLGAAAHASTLPVAQERSALEARVHAVRRSLHDQQGPLLDAHRSEEDLQIAQWFNWNNWNNWRNWANWGNWFNGY